MIPPATRPPQPPTGTHSRAVSAQPRKAAAHVGKRFGTWAEGDAVPSILRSAGARAGRAAAPTQYPWNTLARRLRTWNTSALSTTPSPLKSKYGLYAGSVLVLPYVDRI